jgi:hypothetical protein
MVVALNFWTPLPPPALVASDPYMMFMTWMINSLVMRGAELFLANDGARGTSRRTCCGSITASTNSSIRLLTEVTGRTDIRRFSANII